VNDPPASRRANPTVSVGQVYDARSLQTRPFEAAVVIRYVGGLHRQFELASLEDPSRRPFRIAGGYFDDFHALGASPWIGSRIA
jgi:hypothetical protein